MTVAARTSAVPEPVGVVVCATPQLGEFGRALVLLSVD
jgi:hypothetical protein